MSLRTTVLHEDDEGKVYAVGNAFIVQDKNHENGGEPDPVEVRFHSQNETIGKWSVNAYRHGRWREIGLIMVKRDERGRDNPAHRDALEIRVLTHIPGRESFEDADYQEMVSFRHDGMVLPGGLPSGGSAVPSFLRSPNGRYELELQDDGNFVIYDEHHGHRPVYDSMGHVQPPYAPTAPSQLDVQGTAMTDP